MIFSRGLASFAVLTLMAACAAESSPTPESDALSKQSLRGGAFQLRAKEVILTFDDGPGPYSAALADRLAAQGLPATFFMVGRQVAQRPSAARHIASLGFSLGNHTQNHAQRGNEYRGRREFYDLCQDALRRGDHAVFDELNEAHAQIAEATGVAPTFLRTPGGSWLNPDNTEDGQNPCAKVLGPAYPNYVGPVNWDVGGGDPDRGYLADHDCANVGLCIKSYMRELAANGGKGIILMHDAVASTAKPGGVADGVIKALLAEGYTVRDMRGSELSIAPPIRKRVVVTTDPAPDTNYTPAPGTSCGGPSESCIWSAMCAVNAAPVCVVKGSDCSSCGAAPTPTPGDPCGSKGNCIWSAYCAKGGPLVCATRGSCSACDN